MEQNNTCRHRAYNFSLHTEKIPFYSVMIIVNGAVCACSEKSIRSSIDCKRLQLPFAVKDKFINTVFLSVESRKDALTAWSEKK